MNDGKSRSNLQKSLNFEDLKFSFHTSSIYEPKPSPRTHTYGPADFITPQKESIQNKPSSSSTSAILNLDDIIAGMGLNPDHFDNKKIVKAKAKDQIVTSSMKKRNTIERNNIVCFNDYEYYEKRIIQPQPATQRNPRVSSYLTEENTPSTQRYDDRKDRKSDNISSHRDFDLQSVINEAKSGSRIQLPDHIIKIKKLIINKPLIIQGSPSCILEVTDSIIIDLTKNYLPEDKVVFCECIIKFAHTLGKDIIDQSMYTRRSKISDTRPSTDRIHYTAMQVTTERKTEVETISEGKICPLFIIRSNSYLEVRDCELSSKRTKEIFQDVCFLVEHGGVSIESQRINESNLNPSICIQSSFIRNFSTAIQNNFLGKIYLEKLFISNIHGHALNISDPDVLEVVECTIEDTGKSSLNLRFSGEVPTHTTRKVLIDKNKFVKGGGSGISIYGDNMKAQLCSIEIRGNQLSSFKKDGIGIKNLNIRQVTIEKNNISDSSRNGLFLQNLLDTVSLHQVKLAENKISYSHLYGLFLMDVSCYSEKDEIFQNAKSGIFLSSSTPITKDEISFYKSCPFRVIFNFVNIYGNKESGVSVMGDLKGPVILNSCGIHENTNGFYIKQSPQDVSIVGKSAVQAISDPTGLSNIMLEKCVITQNELSGIHLKQISTKMYLKETLIYDNRNYAIFIQNENEKDHIVFKDGDKSKVKEYIAGYIGGSWGVVFEQNTNICKKATCNVF